MAANVLLLVPPNREPQTAVREAIALAKSRGGTLFVVAAVDADVMQRISDRLSDVGFIGEKVSDQVYETLSREYHERAAELVRSIAEQAGEAGVAAQPLVEEGDPSEVCNRLVRVHDIGLALLVAERRSWLTRLLSRGAIRLPAVASCEVRILEED